MRPRPRVIAYGRTTNLFAPEVVFRLNLIPGLTAPDFGGPFGFHKRFGLVGAYDGDAVGLGRVVVDSTWHHWFSYNLVGIASLAPTEFRKMQAYYRNVGLWLARPADRQSMVVAAIWGVLTGSAPMEFGPNDSTWEIADRVLAALGKTTSPDMLQEFVASFLNQTRRVTSTSRDGSGYERPLPLLPEVLATRALVGSIGRALLGVAFKLQSQRSKGRGPRLDVDAIQKCAIDGVSRGYDLLRTSINDAAAAYASISSSLDALDKSQIQVRIPVKTYRVRLIADALQLPDMTDPALIGGSTAVTIRLRRDDDDGGGDGVPPGCFVSTTLPAFEVRGGMNELRNTVGEIELQTGESLVVEVLAGEWGAEAGGAEAVRFLEKLRGEPSTWIGKRAPKPSQAWRFWYRIEDVGGYGLERKT